MHWHWQQERWTCQPCGVSKRESWHRGNSDRAGMLITFQQASWLLLGAWFIYSSKLIWKAMRKWLQGTSSAWSRAYLFTWRELWTKSLSAWWPQQARGVLWGMWSSLGAWNSEWQPHAFVCFVLCSSFSHWGVRLPVTLGGSPCCVSHLCELFGEDLETYD